MSRYHPREGAHHIYEAAEYWRDNCLLNDGSIFNDKQLWSRENIERDFEKRFIDFIVPTPEFAQQKKENKNLHFTDQWIFHLERVKADPEIYQLLAEFLWVIYQAGSGIKPATKMANCRKLWEKSGTELPDHKYWQDQHLKGLGVPGAAFNFNMWFELLVFILFVREIKILNTDDRKRLFLNGDGKELFRMWDAWPQKWYKKWPQQWEKHFNSPNHRSLKAENCQIRHMVLHLLFPDYIERAFSNSDKKKITKIFKNIDVSEKPWSEIDSTILSIREEQEAEHGPNFDFYERPYNSWKESYPKRPKLIGEKPLPVMPNAPLNQIFYGPPGTGKTWHTTSHALAIVEGKPVEDIKGEDRELVNQRFAKLKETGQIEMVTFHQSVSYEDFIEGIKPIMDDNSEHVRYEIADGVFKKIANRARQNLEKSLLKPEEFDLNILLQDFAEYINEQIEKGEIINFWKDRPTKLVGVRRLSSGKVQFQLALGPRQTDYTVSSNVVLRDYKGVISGEIKDYKDIKPTYASSSENYGDAIYLFPIMRKIKEYQDNIWQSVEQSAEEKRNFVLIIDEINRGNISRIFGELLTLIEESKRIGRSEATEVTLPYSTDPFGIPDNLYIIGTMNTADRSIALLDTALRRRFRFVEMMPKWELLSDIEVGEIDIAEMLKVMNERIEALYDRDHQIGHSYFLRLADNNNTIETLKDIFQHEVLPLLQEYFYDDWEKINLVLNDNKFLKYEDPPKMPSNDFMDNEKKLWSIDEKALGKSANYQDIYTNEQVDSSS